MARGKAHNALGNVALESKEVVSDKPVDNQTCALKKINENQALLASV